MVKPPTDYLRVGDTVKHRSKGDARHWPKSREGHIVKIDGAYIDVQPDGCWWLADCYEWELKLVRHSDLSPKRIEKWARMVLRHYNQRMDADTP